MEIAQPHRKGVFFFCSFLRGTWRGAALLCYIYILSNKFIHIFIPTLGINISTLLKPIPGKTDSKNQLKLVSQLIKFFVLGEFIREEVKYAPVKNRKSESRR
jgi:hypothetical protein